MVHICLMKCKSCIIYNSLIFVKIIDEAYVQIYCSIVTVTTSHVLILLGHYDGMLNPQLVCLTVSHQIISGARRKMMVDWYRPKFNWTSYTLPIVTGGNFESESSVYAVFVSWTKIAAPIQLVIRCSVPNSGSATSFRWSPTQSGPHLLGLENVKNTNPTSQTHTQRERDQDLRGSVRCLRPRGRKERSKYKRITIGSLKNSHQKSTVP